MDAFIAFDTEKRRYIADIDTHSGRTDLTGDPRQARIFRGPSWRAHWTDPAWRGRFTLMTAPPDPTGED